MSPRTRRLVGLGAAVVLLLFVGRSLALLLSDRWWAATLSPQALAATTHWTLYGWALDAAAMLVASTWFALQGLIVARGIASVTVAQHVGNEEIPVAVAPRVLGAWAIGVGVLLGTLTGYGAHSWRSTILLANAGVDYGVVEPISGADLGVFVAQLPLWDLLYDFAITLALLGLALTAVLYFATGGIRRGEQELVVHPHSRRHLGGLFAIVALLVGVGALLHPYSVVVRMTEPLPMVAARVQGLASQAMFGAAIAVAALSIAWALRGRHSLLMASWIVLALAWIGQRFLVPVLSAPTAPVENADAAIRAASELAWGMSVIAGAPSLDTLPMVTGRWDASTLERVANGQGATLLAATPGMTVDGDTLLPVWYLALAQRDSAGVEAVTLQESTEPLRDPTGTLSRLHYEDLRLRPDGGAWREVTSDGVRVGGIFRRTMMAWGRQAGGLLQQPATAHVDWNLDPAQRAAALLPFASWLPPEFVIIGERPLWVVQGVIPIEDFPLSTRARWGAREVAGVVPAFVALMDPWTGAVEFHRDPAATAVGEAWARIMGDVIAPAGRLPPAVRDALPYPRILLETQLRVLEAPAWQLGRRPGRRVADGPPEVSTPTWNQTEGPGWQSAFEDPERLVMTSLVTGSRRLGVPRITVTRYDGEGPENGREIERLWNRLPPLLRWRDSARAAKDSLVIGTVRWHLGPAGLLAWQPVIALNRFGRVTALAVATSAGGRVAAARDPLTPWGGVLNPAAPVPLPTLADDAERWAKARRWITQADSALSRGDLTAFGRAFEALRLLNREPPK